MNGNKWGRAVQTCARFTLSSRELDSLVDTLVGAKSLVGEIHRDRFARDAYDRVVAKFEHAREIAAVDPGLSKPIAEVTVRIEDDSPDGVRPVTARAEERND